MKKSLVLLAFCAAFSAQAFAQTAAPATGMKAASAAKPPAAMANDVASQPVHAMCKDGTAYSGETLKGACHGHGGVDKKATSASKETLAPASRTPAATATAEAAAGGGDGKVWVNTSTKTYHCQGDKYYGKTKHGEYLMEAEAKTKGFHASHGKVCTK